MSPAIHTYLLGRMVERLHVRSKFERDVKQVRSNTRKLRAGPEARYIERLGRLVALLPATSGGKKTASVRSWARKFGVMERQVWRYLSKLRQADDVLINRISAVASFAPAEIKRRISHIPKKANNSLSPSKADSAKRCKD